MSPTNLMRRVGLAALLAAWWFALNTSAGSVARGRVIGPFVTKPDCDLIREQFDPGTTTTCWIGVNMILSPPPQSDAARPPASSAPRLGDGHR